MKYIYLEHLRLYYQVQVWYLMNWGVGSLGAAIKQQVFTWPEFHIIALCNWGKTFQAFSWY